MKQIMMYVKLTRAWAFSWIKTHRIVSVIMAVVLIGIGWYTVTHVGGGANVSYVTGVVATRDISTVVSGSGQVSAATQIDLSPDASGALVYVGVTENQQVAKGQLIAQLDAGTAYKAVRDAEYSLESAQLSMDKLNEPATESDITVAEHNLAAAEENKIDAETDLVSAYEDGFNAVTSSFVDLPDVMTGMNNLMFNASFSNSTYWNIDYYSNKIAKYDSNKAVAFRQSAYDAYSIAREKYDDTFAAYKLLQRDATDEEIVAMVEDSYETTQAIADAVKAMSNLVQLYQDTMSYHSTSIESLSDTHLSSLNSYTSKTNSHLSSLSGIVQSIKKAEDAIVTAERTIVERQNSLNSLLEGPDTYELRNQEISILQKENSLADAKETLADYYVYAPFAGKIVGLDATIGEDVSTGTVLGTLITDDLMVTIDLNEVDAVTVAVGQPVSLTFDAFEDVTLAGEVVQVDAMGTVTQGVVTYGVDIMLTETDDRIKPGMSASAEITTEERAGVLAVSNSAISFVGDRAFVQVLDVDSSSVNSNGDRPVASSDGETERVPNDESMTDDERTTMRAQMQEQFGETLPANSRSSGTTRITSASSSTVTSDAAPRKVEITTGLSDDLYTEVLSGLTEGQVIVLRTIEASDTETSASSTASATQQSSILQMGGGPTGGGGGGGGYMMIR